MKAGIKTSEFYLTIVGALVPLLNQLFGWNIPLEAVLSVTGSLAAYVLSRGVAKKA